MHSFRESMIESNFLNVENLFIPGSIDTADSILPQIPESPRTGTIQKYAN